MKFQPTPLHNTKENMVFGCFPYFISTLDALAYLGFELTQVDFLAGFKCYHIFAIDRYIAMYTRST